MDKQIWHWLIRRLLKYTAFFIAPFERPFISKHARKTPSFRPVFIIGPPRSGSTILYQVLTEYLNVLYIDNLINMARGTTWFGFWLSHLSFGAEPHHSFDSDLGSTKGLHSPNEGIFWYRWLPKTKHFVEPNEITDQSKKEMIQIVHALINKYQKPIVFKNLSFSTRLALIHDLFPGAKIIYIKRDPLYVAQSILAAREKSNIPDNKLWSIKPKNYKDLEKMPNPKQAVHQTWHLYKQIETDLAPFPSNQIMTLWYKDLENTNQIVEKLSHFIGGRYRKNITLKSVSPKNKKNIDKKTFDEIKDEIALLDWSCIK